MSIKKWHEHFDHLLKRYHYKPLKDKNADYSDIKQNERVYKPEQQ